MMAGARHGRVPTARADAYQAHLYRTGIPDYDDEYLR